MIPCTVETVIEQKNTSFLSGGNTHRRLFCIDKVEKKGSLEYVTLRILEEYPNGVFKTIETGLYNPFAWSSQTATVSSMSKGQFDSLWFLFHRGPKNA